MQVIVADKNRMLYGNAVELISIGKAFFLDVLILKERADHPFALRCLGRLSPQEFEGLRQVLRLRKIRACHKQSGRNNMDVGVDKSRRMT